MSTEIFGTVADATSAFSAACITASRMKQFTMNPVVETPKYVLKVERPQDTTVKFAIRVEGDLIPDSNDELSVMNFFKIRDAYWIDHESIPSSFIRVKKMRDLWVPRIWPLLENVFSFARESDDSIDHPRLGLKFDNDGLIYAYPLNVSNTVRIGQICKDACGLNSEPYIIQTLDTPSRRVLFLFKATRGSTVQFVIASPVRTIVIVPAVDPTTRSESSDILVSKETLNGVIGHDYFYFNPDARGVLDSLVTSGFEVKLERLLISVDMNSLSNENVVTRHGAEFDYTTLDDSSDNVDRVRQNTGDEIIDNANIAMIDGGNDERKV